MKYFKLLFALILTPTILIAQQQSSVWVSGDHVVEFMQDEVIVSLNPNPFDSKGTSSVSDENGNLLFYTSGLAAYDKNFEIMPNGVIASEYDLDFRESIIVKHPSQDHLFYIFSIFPFYNIPESGLYYSIVDMSLNGGLGDVTIKNTKLFDSTSNKIAAIHDMNNNISWVLVQKGESNQYAAFKLSNSGLESTPVISSLGREITSQSEGQMKFSPDGTILACGYGTFSAHITPLDGEGVQLFNFDIVSGTLSNDLLILLPDDIRPIESVEFSEDGTKLYAFQSGSIGEQGLYQYDLTVPWDEISDTQVKVGDHVYNIGSQLQRAPNGKIYLAKGGGSEDGLGYYGVINFPNLTGQSCEYVEKGLFLEGGNAFIYTPNFVQTVTGGSIIDSAESIPTLGEWSILILAQLLLIVFLVAIKTHVLTTEVA